MSDQELRREAKDAYAEWHEEQFECHPSAQTTARTGDRYHSDFVEQAFIDAFVLGIEWASHFDDHQEEQGHG